MPYTLLSLSNSTLLPLQWEVQEKKRWWTNHHAQEFKSHLPTILNFFTVQLRQRHLHPLGSVAGSKVVKTASLKMNCALEREEDISFVHDSALKKCKLVGFKLFVHISPLK
ncbi:hypothetical protein P9112_013719 [Eukaryota sp. TZLM1-RC]